MTATPRRTAVAFLFFSSVNEWQGGKNYFRSLFAALDTDPDRMVNFYAFFGMGVNPSELDFPATVTTVRSAVLDRGRPAWFFDQVCRRVLGCTPLLKRLLKRHGIQVVSHCNPCYAGSLKSIAWIPDFQHVHLPRFFQPKELKDRDSQFSSILARADRVIVSSHAALDDLTQFSPTHAEKARVLQFCAVRPATRSQDDKDVVSLYGLKRTFFYLPNQFWAHKNHRLAIEALASLHTDWPDVQIVCSGALKDHRNPKHIADLQKLIAELNLQEHFKLLGLIPYHHIAQLMDRAVAVINPSYFEGWSTTVEEAKSLGAPLLLSNLRVHREQCPGDEALFFEPDDSNMLSVSMAKILSSEWPGRERSGQRELALESHRMLELQLARTYQSIVGEVCNMDSNHHV